MEVKGKDGLLKKAGFPVREKTRVLQNQPFSAFRKPQDGFFQHHRCPELLLIYA